MSNAAAVKRIVSKDMKSIQKNNLHENGIFIEFNENDVTQAVAMIIAPEDSVYENGIFFFVIKFPHNYPFSPPKVSYVSRGSMRIHPNLYTGGAQDKYLGKVCISLLNTWAGPQWTSIMDISSILLSIQSLMDLNPLENEPGFAGKQTDIHELYKQAVEYETMRTLVLRNVFDIPEEFMCFQEVIYENYKKNRDRIVEFIKGKIKSGDNRPICISVYRINTKLSYGILLSKLKELETKI